MDNNSAIIDLNTKIEDYKEKLNRLIVSHNYNVLHPEVIELSQLIDILLLEKLESRDMMPF